MACNLALGRTLPCKDQIGGIKALYFCNVRPAVGYDVTDTDEIDEVGTITVFQYNLPNNSGALAQTGTVSEQNGTAYFAQSLTLNLTTLTKEDHKELKLMQQTKPRVFVLDNNDNLFLMGLNFGCMVAVNVNTGQAKADLTGYSLTITAEELAPANFLTRTAGEGTSGYPFDNVTGTVTITT